MDGSQGRCLRNSLRKGVSGLSEADGIGSHADKNVSDVRSCILEPNQTERWGVMTDQISRSVKWLNRRYHKQKAQRRARQIMRRNRK